MRNKMVTRKMNGKGRTNDVNVIHKGRENTRRNNLQAEHHNAQKWASTKRGPMNGLPWWVPSKEWMMDEEKGNLIGIKRPNKGEKLK